MRYATRVAASRQSRYLRDTSRAVEALVLSAWYAAAGMQPASQLPARLPALRSERYDLVAPVLAEMLESAPYAVLPDGSLGLAQTKSPPELRAAISDGISQAFTTAEALRGLSGLLDLNSVPRSIECFDISHLYGTNTVGACSALSLGATALDAYACYPIGDGVAPADDPGAISATLREHFSSGREPPSVLLIDGGKGQLSAAMGVLEELGLGTHPRHSNRPRSVYVHLRCGPWHRVVLIPTSGRGPGGAARSGEARGRNLHSAQLVSHSAAANVANAHTAAPPT